MTSAALAEPAASPATAQAVPVELTAEQMDRVTGGTANDSRLGLSDVQSGNVEVHVILSCGGCFGGGLGGDAN
jgi:hypothetical protein